MLQFKSDFLKWKKDNEVIEIYNLFVKKSVENPQPVIEIAKNILTNRSGSVDTDTLNFALDLQALEEKFGTVKSMSEFFVEKLPDKKKINSILHTIMTDPNVRANDRLKAIEMFAKSTGMNDDTAKPPVIRVFPEDDLYKQLSENQKRLTNRGI